MLTQDKGNAAGKKSKKNIMELNEVGVDTARVSDHRCPRGLQKLVRNFTKPLYHFTKFW